jgi:hypothetical protein
MKGIDEPVTLHAPTVPDEIPSEPGDGHAETFGMRLRGALGARPGRTSTLPGAN